MRLHAVSRPGVAAEGPAGAGRRWLWRAIGEAPHLREPYLELARLLYEEAEWDGVVYLCRQALAITDRPQTYICEAEAWGSLPWDLLSLGLYHTGRRGEALEAARQALALSPEDGAASGTTWHSWRASSPGPAAVRRRDSASRSQGHTSAKKRPNRLPSTLLHTRMAAAGPGPKRALAVSRAPRQLNTVQKP